MKNFSLFKTFPWAISVIFSAGVLSSCCSNAVIDGSLADAPSSQVVVKLLDVNRFDVLDTVSVDADGRFAYKMHIEKGQPEFVYLFHGDKRIASLLLDRGDKVIVKADTTGVYEVEGSEDCRLLAEVEKEFSDFSSSFLSLASRLEQAVPGSDNARELTREMGRVYTEYYRDRVKYVMEHPYSLTVIPVFYQSAGENLPVFGQDTDAIHFRNICDSLETVYPESKYVESLRAEAERRADFLELRVRLQGAEEVGFPDIELSDVNAVRHRLSDVDAKVIMVHFWSSGDAMQKMFNLDVLRPVYGDFHSKGFEIYQVALDADKAVWARTVKDQGLEWINVCDVLGLNSPAARSYNVGSLPVSFFIADGELVNATVSDEASLRALLRRLL